MLLEAAARSQLAVTWRGQGGLRTRGSGQWLPHGGAITRPPVPLPSHPWYLEVLGPLPLRGPGCWGKRNRSDQRGAPFAEGSILGRSRALPPGCLHHLLCNLKPGLTLPRAPGLWGSVGWGPGEGFSTCHPKPCSPLEGEREGSQRCAGVGTWVLGSSTGTPTDTSQRKATAWAPRSLVPLLFSSDALLLLWQMTMTKTSTSAAEGVRTRTSRFGVLKGEKRVLLPFSASPSAALCPGEGFHACI